MMTYTLPKRLANYVHDTGVRALDRLAEIVERPEDGKEVDALQTLVGQWRRMSDEEREDFVTSVAAAVGDVIAASTLLPMGVEVGKKAVKSAKKVIKRGAKTLKRTAKRADDGWETIDQRKKDRKKKGR